MKIGLFVAITFVLSLAHGQILPKLEASYKLYDLKKTDLKLAPEKNQQYQEIIDSFYPKNRRGKLNFNRYSPSLFSLAGVFHSTSFPRRHKFQTINLEIPENHAQHAHYQKSLTAYYQSPGKENYNPKIFVLFQGSFSNFEDGRQINQTIEYLNNLFNQPAIIVLDGFATKETYKAKPKFPILNGRHYGKDLFYRLKQFIGTLPYYNSKQSKAGLIGYSGGASFLLQVLKEDEHTNGNGKELFNLGGLSLSPVLRLQEVKNNMDNMPKKLTKKGISSEETLTDFYTNKALSDIKGLAGNLITKGLSGTKKSIMPPATDFLDLLSDSTKEKDFLTWEKRFFNEFKFKNLAVIARSFKQKKFKNFEEYFKFSHEKHIENSPYLEELSFSEYTSVMNIVPNRLPVLMVFTLDDPVLQNAQYHENQAVSEEMEDTINELTDKGNFTVFTPDFGGHLGYLLDNHFIKTMLSEFFEQEN